MTCKECLEELQQAKRDWVKRTDARPDAQIGIADIHGEGLLRWPYDCPEGGRYTLNNGDQAPTCRMGELADHRL